MTVPGGALAENYNFGERPATTGLNFNKQAAGIGFWQNTKGQALIKARRWTLRGSCFGTSTAAWWSNCRRTAARARRSQTAAACGCAP